MTTAPVTSELWFRSLECSYVYAVAFSPDGQTIAVGTGYPHTIRVLDVATGHEVRRLAGQTDQMTSLVFIAHDGIFASGGADNTITLWDVPSGKELATLVGHTGPVRCVAADADGRLLASGSQDTTIRLWDMMTGAELSVIRGHTGDEDDNNACLPRQRTDLCRWRAAR